MVTVNRALARHAGVRLVRLRRRRAGRPAGVIHPPAPPPRPGDRLVEAPTFILSSIRSGSTLLRVLLNSHPEIHAPHELHLRAMSIRVRGRWARAAINELGLGGDGLQFLLWDRLLHRLLAASGKRLIVDKTPNNVFIADRLRECWPDARFIYLLRNPAAIARSRAQLRPADGRNVERIREYCEALEHARQRYPGLTVRYEDLTADPAAITREVCAFLGVEWEASMLDYGAHDHGPYVAGLGDFAAKIGRGRVQRAAPAPLRTPGPLRAVSAAWGYERSPEGEPEAAAAAPPVAAQPEAAAPSPPAAAEAGAPSPPAAG
jgi:hypothetical protein